MEEGGLAVPKSHDLDDLLNRVLPIEPLWLSELKSASGRQIVSIVQCLQCLYSLQWNAMRPFETAKIGILSLARLPFRHARIVISQ